MKGVREMRKLLTAICVMLCLTSYAQSRIDYSEMIGSGQLSEAKIKIKYELVNNDTLSQYEVLQLKKQLGRIHVILDEYTYTYDEMFDELKKEIPNLTSEDIRNWEADTSLEYHWVDGKKRYYWAFSYNLFKLNTEAKKRQIQEEKKPKRKKKYDHIQHKLAVIEEAEKTGEVYVLPKRIKVCMTFGENIKNVPDGTIVRGWLPFPRETKKQRDIQITSMHPRSDLIFNKGKYLNASAYVEKKVQRSELENAYWIKNLTHPPEVWRASRDRAERFVNNDYLMFQVAFEYTAYGVYRHIDETDILPYDTTLADYQRYTREERPHLAFTASLKALSEEIVGEERHPYLKAKKIYAWICKNVPWTSPEYSALRCLSDDVARLQRGDCGIKAFLFVSLCRLNGIPARLQGGWMVRPFGGHTQHGWAQMYMEPYGWMTVDPDAGSHLIDHENEQLKYFHFGNCDTYRLIIYDDTLPLFPLKIHGSQVGTGRTGGMQLGAFEWTGGGLENGIIIDSSAEE